MRRPIRPDGEEEDEEVEEFAPRVYRPHVAINIHNDNHTHDDVAIATKKAPPSKWLAHLPLGIRLSVTAVLLVIFFLSVSAVPIWNKEIFAGDLPGATPFPYALTVTFLQLAGTDVLLFLVVLATAGVYAYRAHNRTRHYGAEPPEPLKPFYFTHRFLFKLWHTLPIGVLFGFKLGLTNWGLHLAPTVNFHLLVQACSLFFVILFAFFILRERPTIWALLCAAGATAGAILVSLQFEHAWGLGDKWWVIGVNFASAIFEGLSIVFLRRARNILAKAFPEERDVLLIIQITFMKLVISALAVLPFALAIEGWWNPLKDDILWKALPETSLTLIPYIFIGSIFTFLFQCDYTTLTFLAGAQDVGVLSHIKIVPQVAFSEAVFQNFEPTWEKIVGLVLVLVSGVCYGVLKWFHLTHSHHHHHHHKHHHEEVLLLSSPPHSPPLLSSPPNDRLR